MIEDVQVERLNRGLVAVRWTRTAPGPVTVEAFTSFEERRPAPQSVVCSVATEADEVHMTLPELPRHLVAVRAPEGPAIVAAERRIPLPGTLNFRDLGGYVGAHGRRVRWGRVFRSDNFGAVPAEGWASVRDLGVRTVFDLRHEAERERAPTRLPLDLSITTTHLPIGGEAAEAPDLVELLRSRDAEAFGVEFMIEMNKSLVRDHAAVFGRLFDLLAQPGSLPAVFHCTAGKDRTGIAAALILELLGVDRGQVLDDYELTTHYRSQHRIAELRPGLEAAGIDVEAVRPFLSAPRPALEAALRDLDERYGGVEAYLTGAAAVARDVPARLRDELLDGD